MRLAAVPRTSSDRPGTVDAVLELFELPFSDLLHRAQSVHREHFDPNTVQLSTLLSIKTGGCPEDCGYCPQSVRYHTGVQAQELMPLDEVVDAARRGEGRGRDALLHGRGLARAEGQATSSRCWTWCAR